MESFIEMFNALAVTEEKVGMNLQTMNEKNLFFTPTCIHM